MICLVSAWKTKKTYLTSLSLHSVNDCWSTEVQSVSQQQFTSHPLPVRSQVQPFKIKIGYSINGLCTHNWSNVCIWAHVTTGLVLYFPRVMQMFLTKINKHVQQNLMFSMRTNGWPLIPVKGFVAEKSWLKCIGTNWSLNS